MVILIIIYIISIIGAILSIRYDQAISIDVDTLLQLIKDSEKLAALEAEGVDNWEGYSLAMKELNTGYQKDAITDEVLIKQYCE